MEKFRKIRAFLRHLSAMKIPVYAAHTGYFVVLSLFPLLLLILSLLRSAGLGVDSLTGLLDGVIPSALLPAARLFVTGAYRNTSGTVISLSAVAVLWSASRGVYGFITGLNAIYGVKESRGYFRTRWLSVVYTFLFLLLLLAALTLNVMGSSVQTGGLLSFLEEVVQLRFLLLLLLQALIFAVMFTYLPNRPGRLRDSIPGALLASCGWLAFSDLYSLYVGRSSPLSSTYGSMYAVALSMLWLYGCLCIVFYGGVLNRLLIEKPDFTEE